MFDADTAVVAGAVRAGTPRDTLDFCALTAGARGAAGGKKGGAVTVGTSTAARAGSRSCRSAAADFTAGAEFILLSTALGPYTSTTRRSGSASSKTE